MERVRDLIQKLQEQSAQNDAPHALLTTVRQLAAELEALAPATAASPNGRVAVMLPAGFIPKTELPLEIREAAASEATLLQTPAPPPEPVVRQEPETLEPETPKPVSAEASTGKPETVKPETPKPASLKPELPFNALDDVPTLAQQAKEVHQLHDPGTSLNDRLRTAEPELATKLTGGPIKDLRKGIGVNDRYLFVSELFRGDEAMYERSIKTINAFSIFPEAEYWINRELKVKLGWDEAAPTVRHFYALVSRRFS